MNTHTSEIRIKIKLDDKKLPERLTWEASDAADGEKACKAFNLSIWDAADRSTLRIDLWTKDMPVSEMTTHFLQTLLSLSETFERATGVRGVVEEMKPFTAKIAECAGEQLGAKNPESPARNKPRQL